MTARHILILCAVYSSVGSAGDEYVHKADANGDGFVSLHELRAAHYADPEFNQRIEQTFSSYDRDGDGLISASERRRDDSQTGKDGANAQTGMRSTENVPQTIGSSAGSGLPAAPVAEARVAEQGGGIALENDTRTLQVAEPLVLTRSAKRRDDSVPDKRGSGNDVDAVAAGTLRNEASDNRYTTWLREIDTDFSGGASRNELLASSDGKPWFIDADFKAADRNRDDELDETELARLIQSLERRQR